MENCIANCETSGGKCWDFERKSKKISRNQELWDEKQASVDWLERYIT